MITLMMAFLPGQSTSSNQYLGKESDPVPGHQHAEDVNLLIDSLWPATHSVLVPFSRHPATSRRPLIQILQLKHMGATLRINALLLRMGTPDHNLMGATLRINSLLLSHW